MRSRKSNFSSIALYCSLLAAVCVCQSADSQPAKATAFSSGDRIPVVLDTDIGGDIDDTWALAFLLRCPELELKLLTTDYCDTTGKARIAAKFLERVGRADIPIGIGVPTCKDAGASWAKDYDLSKYPGKVHKDGVQAMINVIMNSPRPVTLITIAPVRNIAEALRRQPAITKRARLVLMGGSIDKQYYDKPGRCAECNVICDPASAKAVYQADWDVTMTPLDTAGVVRLEGDNFARVRSCRDVLPATIIENYGEWPTNSTYPPDIRAASSVLFDTVAVYLAFDDHLCEMRDLKIRVTEKGVTEPSPEGKLMHVAINWKDLPRFHKVLTERIAPRPRSVR